MTPMSDTRGSILASSSPCEISLEPPSDPRAQPLPAIRVPRFSERLRLSRVRVDRGGQRRERAPVGHRVDNLGNHLAGMWRDDRAPAEAAARVVDAHESLCPIVHHRAIDLPQRHADRLHPEDLLLTREAVARLQGAIADLPEGQRAVITLRDHEGLAAPDVCNILGISETNQRVLLHRARTKVRARGGPSGVAVTWVWVC